MKLLHYCFLTDLPIAEEIDHALKDTSTEVEIAVSKHFWDFEGDMEAVWNSWNKFYADTLAEAKKILGAPKYENDFEDDSYGDEWREIFDEQSNADHYAIWEVDGEHFYLRMGQEDCEIPITIAFGAALAKPAGEVYPGMFDD